MMRSYDLLLRLYPASFRAEYGEEMRAIWARRRRDAAGPLAVAAVWIAMLFEVVFNAAAVHWDILRQDLRYTARTLARSPGFALTAILVLALGVGANTAAFSVTDFVLIRPLPFPEPGRLVNLWEKEPGYPQIELSPANYVDWKHMSKSFDGMGAFWDTSVNLVGQGDPERLEGATVTADLLPLLRVQPLMGRVFTAAEDRDGAPGTLLLSYQLWQAVFGGDAGVIGKRVSLDNEPYEVIGVMPRDFHFPSRNAELWIPARFQEQSDDFRDRNNNYLNVVGRLKPGVSLAQARAEMGVVAAQLERQFPKENRQTTAAVNFLRDELSQQSYTPKDLVIRSATAPGTLLPALRQIIHGADAEQPVSDVRTMADIVEEQTASRTAQVRVLAAFAVIAFLLAGVGIHGLLSFAVSRRTQEIGVRIALGARPGGIVRMIVRQGAVLAGAGVLPGVALAYAAGRALEGLLAGVQPGDAATFASAIGLCVLMTVLGSLLPALRAVHIDPIAAIRSE
jgi:hypothetical protein